MKTNRTNPLDEVEFWFTSLTDDMQEQIARIANHYHIDKAIYKANTLEAFLSYMDSSELDDREILSRTLFVTRLIQFSFTGRETDEDWEITLDRLLLLRSRILEEGGSTELEDKAISNINDSKRIWMDIAADWQRLMDNEVSNKKVIDWYFDPLLRRKK